jgi:hypothetical protein
MSDPLSAADKFRLRQSHSIHLRHDNASLDARIVGYREDLGGANRPEHVQVLVEVLRDNDDLGLDAGTQVLVAMSRHPDNGNVMIKDLLHGSVVTVEGNRSVIPACPLGSEISFVHCTAPLGEEAIQASSFRVVEVAPEQGASPGLR